MRIQSLTDEQRKTLQAAGLWTGFASNPIWKKVRDYLEEEVKSIEGKIDSHFDNEEYPDQGYVFRLSQQLYERKKVIRDVLAEIASIKGQAEAIREEIAENPDEVNL